MSAHSHPRGRSPTRIAMLLDNEYAPDPRVALETELLTEAGFDVTIVAWDRRPTDAAGPSASTVDGARVLRVNVPARRGGSWRTLLAMLRFARRVWRRKDEYFRATNALVVHDIYLLPLGRLLAGRFNLPFVYDAHEDFARMEFFRYPRWFLRLTNSLETRLARRARSIVVPGTSRQARWTSVGATPIVVRNVRRRATPDTMGTAIRWDILHGGTLSQDRRLDVLIELARARPEVRVAIAGRGRLETEIAATAGSLPNVDYLGWRSDLDALTSQTRVMYYGLDPTHPVSPIACPNTLYQALAHRKPLIYFCGGEMDEVGRRFRIGIRAQPTVESVSSAFDEISDSKEPWDFAAAWEHALATSGSIEYVEAMRTAAGS